jgi:hypothetical protein
LVRGGGRNLGGVRRALFSLGVGPHAELLRITGPTFVEFADRHGYELYLFDANPVPDRPTSWGKVRLFQDLLGSYDEVLWIDADAVIVDATDDITDALRPDDLMGLAAHITPEGVDPIPNCGVWLIRKDATISEFLDSVWQSTEFVEHKWWENAAVLKLLGYALEPQVRLVRPTPMWYRARLLSNEWNSVPIDPSPAPRIVHFAGMSHDERLTGIRQALSEQKTSSNHRNVEPRSVRSADLVEPEVPVLDQ